MIEYRHGAAVCTQRIQINRLHVLNIKSTPVVLVESRFKLRSQELDALLIIVLEFIRACWE